MANTSSRTTPPGETPGSLRLILRPKSLSAGLQPEYPIDHFPATLGRHPVNDVELPFDSVSRYHARFELRQGRPHLLDLRSSNGTFVNGKRVQVAPILDNDSVAFGSVEFIVVIPAEDEEPSSRGVRRYSEKTRTSVHFVTTEEPSQTVFHTELSDETSHSDLFQGEIPDAAALKRAKQRLMTLYKLQDLLRSTTDEERLLQSVLILIFDVLPVDRGVILLRDEKDPAVFRPAAVKVKGSAAENIGISRTILQRCLREKVAVLTRDASADQRFSAADSVVAGQMRSLMVVPLTNGRHFFGFCHLDSTDAVRAFTEDDLKFLAHVGQELAIHLHNLRMVQEKISSERMAAIGQTITGMAHNIKNILVLSQGGVELLEKRLRDRNYDALDETWSIVRRGMERINKLTQEMLDYSRARKAERSRVELAGFLAEIRETFAEEMTRRQIECRFALDEKIPTLMLDADGLEKALVNLIVNAMEAYEDRPGAIDLRTAQAGEGSVVIQVEDQAGGIPAEVLPRIFVPFFTTKGSRGSGLGLAMTRKIIEDMGGYIDVVSTPGGGTCFTITLQVGPAVPRLAGDGAAESPQ